MHAKEKIVLRNQTFFRTLRIRCFGNQFMRNFVFLELLAIRWKWVRLLAGIYTLVLKNLSRIWMRTGEQIFFSIFKYQQLKSVTTLGNILLKRVTAERYWPWLEKHGCHVMILPWSYHGEYESPWSYHVIAWPSCLTMAVSQPGEARSIPASCAKLKFISCKFAANKNVVPSHWFSSKTEFAHFQVFDKWSRLLQLLISLP